jgi:C-terminal processing protease CtpA/Prc
MKGSPADIAGVKRGDLFTYINNTALTMSNYNSLLIENTSYTMAIDTIINQNFTHTGRSVNLTAIEFQENPIYLDTVYTINNKKIGYLVYNAFINNYNKELNDVFLEFRNKAVEELIIDLRYNSGGDEGNMVGLASMIYSTNITDVFMQVKYNSALQSYIVSQQGADYLKRKFVNKVSGTNSSNQAQNYDINSLNLSKLHVITSDNTASAGEVLICGLKPYIPVVLVGDTTVGKYVGSVTLKDEDNQGVVNPNHKWALQPIIMKVANKNGITDYIGGFIPNIKIREQFDNLKQLGDTQEPLLKTTLDYINGTGEPIAVSTMKTRSYEKIADSRDALPFKDGLKADPVKISGPLRK